MSSSHLEFSETSSYPNTPTSPSMANFADFLDPVANATANAELNRAVAVEESYVMSHLTNEQAASVEFASGSALSEMAPEDSNSSIRDVQHCEGSNSCITFTLGHPAGSQSTNSVNIGSAYGSVHGSATNGSIADSYVHAEETLSHYSSGSGQSSPMFVAHSDGSASVLNLPSASVPVRRGLSTPTTHNSQCSFDFVENSNHVDFSSSAGNSTNVSPRTMLSTEDAGLVEVESGAASTAHDNVNASGSTLGHSFTANTIVTPGIAETVEENNGWESDEEFGDFTTSTIPVAPSNTTSSVPVTTNTKSNTKEESQLNLPLQEVDLWKLITEQAQPSYAGGTTSRYTIKEGPVYMMRQGGFPKRWAKKQVWLVLTPLGLILRKDSSPASRIHEVLSLHRPLHTTPSDTLTIGLNGLRVQGSAPVPLSASSHGNHSPAHHDEEGDWVTVTLGGNSSVSAASGSTVGTSNSTHLSSTVTSSDSIDTHFQRNAHTLGKCLFVPVAFEISFEDKDIMNAWLDVIDEQREILL